MIEERLTVVEEIQVPIKLRPYRQYRDIQAFTATFVAALLISLCWAAHNLLYNRFTFPLQTDVIKCAGYFLFLGLGVSIMLCYVANQVRKLTKTLTQKLPGLIINQNGIIDNASDNPAGLICWSQIEKITLSRWYSKSTQVDHSGVAIILKKENQMTIPVYQVFIRQEMIGKPSEEVVRLANDFHARMSV